MSDETKKPEEIELSGLDEVVGGGTKAVKTPPPPPKSDIYLKLDGIDGEQTD